MLKLIIFITVLVTASLQNIVSRGKPTSQSSVAYNSPSSLGVDGNYDQHIMKGSRLTKTCFHTNNELNPWWTVDLQGEFLVDKVVIFNRIDCCSDRVVGSVVELLSKTDETWHECGTITTVESKYVISCGNEFGEKVRIRSTKRTILNLCEVDVHGVSSTPISQGIVSRGKPTSQSSVAFNSPSYLGVDGNYDQHIMKGNRLTKTCFHTNNELNPWWTVDLQGEFLVDKVVIFNRIDCCSDRVVGSVVELLSKTNEKWIECGTITTVEAKYVISCGNEFGEKVRIRSPKVTILNLCEVDVHGVTSDTLPENYVGNYKKIVGQ